MATTPEPTTAEMRDSLIAELLASNVMGNGWTQETAAARVDSNARLAQLRRIERAIEGEYNAAMKAVEAELYPGGRFAGGDEAAVEARHGIPTLGTLLLAARSAVAAEMAGRN